MQKLIDPIEAFHNAGFRLKLGDGVSTILVGERGDDVYIGADGSLDAGYTATGKIEHLQYDPQTSNHTVTVIRRTFYTVYFDQSGLMFPSEGRKDMKVSRIPRDDYEKIIREQEVG